MFKPLEIVNRLTGSSRSRAATAACDDSASSGSDVNGGYESPTSDADLEEDDYLSSKMDVRGEDCRREPTGSDVQPTVDANGDSTTAQSSPPQTGKKVSPVSNKKGENRAVRNTKTPSPQKASANNVSPLEVSTVTTANAAISSNGQSVNKGNNGTSPKNTKMLGKATNAASKRKTNKVANSTTKQVKAAGATPSTTAETLTAETTDVNAKEAVTSNGSSVTPTPAKKKRRLSPSENLEEETQFAYDCMKDMVEEVLKSKKALHKEKLKEIKEAEEKLKRLKETALALEKDIEEDMEKRKKISKHVKNLKRACTRVIEKASKDRETAKANIKAKDAILKQALKDAAKKKSQSDDDEKDGGANKKKRKRSAGEKAKRKKLSGKEEESSDDDNSDDDKARYDEENDSDSDDSDWEGVPQRRKNNNEERVAETESESPATKSRRQTRVRCSLWKCTACTLENDAANNECVACETPKPGFIPEF